MSVTIVFIFRLHEWGKLIATGVEENGHGLCKFGAHAALHNKQELRQLLKIRTNEESIRRWKA